MFQIRFPIRADVAPPIPELGLVDILWFEEGVMVSVYVPQKVARHLRKVVKDRMWCVTRKSNRMVWIKTYIERCELLPFTNAVRQNAAA